MEKSDASNHKVFRDELKEHRGNYYVIYKPADDRLSFANVQLVFPEVNVEVTAVRCAMEQELNKWLNRYPVPLMVSAFDVKDDLISVSSENRESHLMGYVDQSTGRITRRWGLFENTEMPADQLDVKYLACVYKDVPFRLQEEVQQKVRHETRLRGRVLRLIIFLTVAVPVLIEMVALAVTWLGHHLAGISITAGLYKLGKAMGWLEPAEREKEKAERELKMRHYFYHCERNPEAFNRLKAETFEREAIEQTRAQSERLRKNTTQSI